MDWFVRIYVYKVTRKMNELRWVNQFFFALTRRAGMWLKCQYACDRKTTSVTNGLHAFEQPLVRVMNDKAAHSDKHSENALQISDMHKMPVANFTIHKKRVLTAVSKFWAKTAISDRSGFCWIIVFSAISRRRLHYVGGARLHKPQTQQTLHLWLVCCVFLWCPPRNTNGITKQISCEELPVDNHKLVLSYHMLTATGVKQCYRPCLKYLKHGP